MCLLVPAAAGPFLMLPGSAGGNASAASPDTSVQDQGAEILWSHVFNRIISWHLCDDGTIYAMVGDSQLGPFQLVKIGTTGEILWSYPIDGGWSSEVVYDQGIVYIMDGGNIAGTITAVRSADGSALWTLDSSDLRGLRLPVMFDAMVAAPAGGIVVHAPVSDAVPGKPNSTFYLYVDPSGSIGWSLELPIVNGSIYVGESPDLGIWIVSSNAVFHLDEGGSPDWTLDLSGQSPGTIYPGDVLVGPDGTLYMAVGEDDIWNFSAPRELWALDGNGKVLWKACPLSGRDMHLGGDARPLAILENGSLLMYTLPASEESAGLSNPDGNGMSYPPNIPSMLFLIGPNGSVQKTKVLSTYGSEPISVGSNRTYAFNGTCIETLDRNWSIIDEMEIPEGTSILPMGATENGTFYSLVGYPYPSSKSAIVATVGLPKGLAERVPDILGQGAEASGERSVWPNDGSVDRVVIIMVTMLTISTALHIFFKKRERKK